MGLFILYNDAASNDKWGDIMPNTEMTKGALYAHKDLIIYEKVDRDDNIYYPGDDITFTILCLNNSEHALNNVLIQDTIPNEVIPYENDEFKVTTTCGKVTQQNNIISVWVDEVKSKESILIKILGKVSE